MLFDVFAPAGVMYPKNRLFFRELATRPCAFSGWAFSHNLACHWHLLLLVFALLLSPSNLNGFDEPTPLEETMTGSHAPCAIRGKSQVIGRMTPLVLYLMLKRLVFVGAGVHL